MDCLVLPVTIFRSRSRQGYRQLVTRDDIDLVTVVVGKEKREFLVEPFVLEENPFRALISRVKDNFKRVIFVDVDAILFEHMLWLMQNDSSSLFQLNLKEVIEFYAQDN
ncbi:hypothetical protein ACFE04_031781 [Oxalis oulophora]